MVRNRKRKTSMGLHDERAMKEAIELVENGMSYRKAAEMKNIKLVTLHRYVKKKKDSGVDVENLRVVPKYASRKVFPEHLENGLKKYLVTCSKMCYGLDTIEARKLAYELAKHHNLNMPQTWEDRKMAGIDWLYGYRKRHADLTLRKPEPCSLSRATSFNKHNVKIFYDNLEDVMKRHPGFADGTRLFCLDETGTTTVQKPKKVIAAKGSKQLNKVTSGERGTLVTTCCIVSATGAALPPAMVFPRKNFTPHMLNKAPTGTMGLAQPTGWMNTELFPKVMTHFVKITGSSKDNPCLLIVDNHDSHLAPEALNIAKDNGVTLLTIPPHTSHKLQPLDVSVFGPLQTFYNAALDSWMLRNHGVPATIYNISELLGLAFEKAMTPVNITSGFRKTGIFPFDRNTFTEDDFMPCEVTNRPIPEPSTVAAENDEFLNSIGQEANENTMPQPSTSTEVQTRPEDHTAQRPTIDLTQPSTSSEPSIDLTQQQSLRSEAQLRQPDQSTQAPSINSTSSMQYADDGTLLSPIACRGYPKAKERKNTRKGRKKGKSCIATDTPVKAEFEKMAEMKQKKLNR